MRLLRCGIIVLFIYCGSGSAQTAASYGNPVKLNLRIPARHPYLAVTPADIERAKARIARLDWAKLAYAKLLSEADHNLATSWDKLPAKDDEKHWAVAGRIFSAGLAYSLSGEKRYAEWARDGLLAYAALYAPLPLRNYRSKLLDESLYDALWVVKIAAAYDLVADSGVFTAEQKKRVEDGALRPALECFKTQDFKKDPRIEDLHYRCYNFQSWHLASVGLIGLVLRDADSVNYAVNSPYGFRHQMAHDVNDDGLFWERSIGYHNFVLEAYIPLAEAMFHCGVDLYGMSLPTDRSKNEGAHYMTDSSDKPKSFRLMFEGPMYLAFPNFDYPSVGDSDPESLRGGWEELVAFQRYHDPRLAWLIQRDMPTAEKVKRSAPDWHWLFYDAPAGRPAASGLPLKDGVFANSGEFRNGCSLFPSSGLAVLREAGADFTNHPGKTAVSFSYGPYGGGHGHPDKMNIVVYSEGRQWMPDFGSMPYESHWKAEWTAQTVSHNTLVIDGVSQRPAGKRSMWPVDDSMNKVMGKLEGFDPASKQVSGSCRLAYPGFKLRRSVRLAGHDVVDDFVIEPEAASSGVHQFDYVLHIDGTLAQSSIELEPRSGKLAETYGYQHVEQRQAGSTGRTAAFTFASGGKQLRVWVVPSDGAPASVILCDGLTNSPTRKMPTLIVRRNAARARFLSVIEPVKAEDPISGVKLEKDSAGEPAALIVERPTGSSRVPLTR